MKISLQISSSPIHTVRLILLTTTLLASIGLLCFLYRDFYQTIVQADIVVVLQKEVALKNIELELFEKVKTINNYKLQNSLPDTIVNIFGTTPASATTTPATADNIFPPTL